MLIGPDAEGGTIQRFLLGFFAMRMLLFEPVETRESAVPLGVSIESAQETAISYSGFDSVTSGLTAATRVVCSMQEVRGYKTPFLHDKIEGRNVWSVTFDSVFLELEGWYPSVIENQVPKTSVVYIDPDDGTLLKIESRQIGNDPNLYPEPDVESAEKSLRAAGEVYVGLPDVIPAVSPRDALQAAVPSYPLHADQIVGLYVNLDDADGKPVWFILGRGIPLVRPMSHLGKEIPEHLLNRTRSVVDAETGKLLYSDLRPSIPWDTTTQGE